VERLWHSLIQKWTSGTTKLPTRYAWNPPPFDAAGQRDYQWLMQRTAVPYPRFQLAALIQLLVRQPRMQQRVIDYFGELFVVFHHGRLVIYFNDLAKLRIFVI
jgi:hypothetical protein